MTKSLSTYNLTLLTFSFASAFFKKNVSAIHGQFLESDLLQLTSAHFWAAKKTNF